MSVFDIVIIIGGFCGLCMVIGGFVLLYKGIITLKEASPEEALSVEFRNEVRITTHYPALGLFIIGLVFIIAAGMLSRATKNEFVIDGQLTGVENPSSIKVEVIPNGSWDGRVYVGGEMRAEPTLKILDVRISQAGYEELDIPVDIAKNYFGTITIGRVAMHRKVSMPNPGLIVEPSVPLPGPSSSGSYGKEVVYVTP